MSLPLFHCITFDLAVSRVHKDARLDQDERNSFCPHSGVDNLSLLSVISRLL